LTRPLRIRIVSRFGLSSLKQSKQRPVGSVGVEALLDHAFNGRLTIIVA
jgi:hypothetical protein